MKTLGFIAQEFSKSLAHAGEYIVIMVIMIRQGSCGGKKYSKQATSRPVEIDVEVGQAVSLFGYTAVDGIGEQSLWK